MHDLEELDTSLGRNRAFIDRLGGRGKLSAEECLGFAVTGPTLRAAGVASDLRRNEPYLVYEELVFDLPVGLVGDNLDRLPRLHGGNSSKSLDGGPVCDSFGGFGSRRIQASRPMARS